MTNTNVTGKKAVVVGAGISGLSCAYALLKAGVDVTILEKNAQTGGMIASESCDGYVIESGPHTYRRSTTTEELTHELGLSSDYLPRLLKDYDRFICDGNHLIKVPTGPVSFLRTDLLSLPGKLRILEEPFLTTPPPAEESVADFTRRHLGEEVLKMAMGPLVSGIYAGDPEKLSMQAAFPSIAGLARGGSVLRGAFAAGIRRLCCSPCSKERNLQPHKKKLKSALCSYRNGLQQLPNAIAAVLGHSLVLNAQVRGSRALRSDGGATSWQVIVSQNGQDSMVDADAVVIAAPANAAAEIVRESMPEAAQALQQISYTPLIVVHLGAPLRVLNKEIHGFGFLTVRCKGIRALGVLWSSSMFPEHAPPGHVLLTMFYGGATDPSTMELDDAELQRVAVDDIRKTLGFTGEPTLFKVKRHSAALPAYELGHVERIKVLVAAAACSPAPIKFVGNYMGGISISDCVTRGINAAMEILKEWKAASETRQSSWY